MAISADEGIARQRRYWRPLSYGRSGGVPAGQAVGGAGAAKEAEDHAQALMIQPRTLRRARKKLGVVAEKGGLKEGWKWRLPSEGYSTTNRHSDPRRMPNTPEECH